MVKIKDCPYCHFENEVETNGYGCEEEMEIECENCEKTFYAANTLFD